MHINHASVLNSRCHQIIIITHILSSASEAGSPTNRSGSDKTRGQGSFGPSTGGPDQVLAASDLIHVKLLTIDKLPRQKI